MKTILLIIIPLFLFPNCLHGQMKETTPKQDTLYQWRSKFFDISIHEVSPSGRWFTLHKWRNLTSDTVMLVDAHHPEQPPLNIVKMLQLHFTPGNYLLSRGADRAAWWDLPARKVREYKNVKQAAVLAATNSYMILDKNKDLKIFDKNTDALFEETDVSQIISNGNENVAFLKLEDKKSVIYTWNSKVKNKVFTSEDDVVRFTWTSSGKYLILTLADKITKKQNAALLDPKTGSIQNSFSDGKSEPTYTTLNEINENSFFVENQTTRKLPDKVVELWYGNDGDLNANLSASQSVKDYGYYNALTKKLASFPTEKYPAFSNIMNERFFLAFNRNRDQNYIRWVPDVDFYLYDVLLKEYTSIGRVRNHIAVSPQGEYLVYQNADNKWMIFDVEKQQGSIISSLPLYDPVFELKGKNLFFGSKNGAYLYDLQKKTFQRIKNTKGLASKIINTQSKNLSTAYNIHLSFIEEDKSVLIKLFDPVNNKTSCGIYKKGNFNLLVNPTENFLDDFNYSEKTHTLMFREENYNLFPRIKMANAKGENVLYTDESQNEIARKIHQEVISYKDSRNSPLTGLLYYPTDFDPKKKYPLIVHIYQIQSKFKNEFTTPGEMSDEGFDLRALLEKGYLVYLPDIVFGNMGPGFSALDCVNKALDALGSKPFVDLKRIGLTGHSYGGYETNFIATHSDRFATYVSGAGNSDLVRSYFSYNYNFSSPYYWQFENGQYEMTSSFAQDKNVYINNSPIYNVDKVSAPILLWAGKKDLNIIWDQSMEFFVGLKRNNKEVVTLFYPNAGHSVTINSAEMRDLNERILDWWDYFLKDRKDIPWIQKQIKKDAH